jgi:hypothetical protein
MPILLFLQLLLNHQIKSQSSAIAVLYTIKSVCSVKEIGVATSTSQTSAA